MAVSSLELCTIVVDSVPGVVTVRLNRPDRRNTISTHVLDELTSVARQLKADTATQVVILTGAETFFSAGADASERLPLSLLERRRFASKGPTACSAWESLDQITICAIEGYCVGGAMALALACDFRIAGKGAYLQLPEVAVGMNMSWQAIPRLVSLIGSSRTKRLAIFGDRLGAKTASDWGAVDEISEDGEAVDVASSWAHKILALPPVSVQMTKESINAAANALHHSSSFMDRDQFLLTATSEEFAEGLAAALRGKSPDLG